MIEIVRVDERLVHGQVATKVLKCVKMDTILVIDDETYHDDLAVKAVKMAALGANLTGNVKTVVKDTDSAIRQLNDPRAKNIRIAIVIRDLNSLKRLVDEVEGVDNINIGVYGNQMPTSTARKNYALGLSLNEEEAEILKYVANQGKRVYFRLINDSPAEDILKLLK